jgi:hypothetical protein
VRLVVLSAVVWLLTPGVSAQSPASPDRIRIGGLENYQPAPPAASPSASSEAIVIPRPGDPLVGDVLGVEHRFVRLRIDAVRDVRVPLDAIATLEVSGGRRSKLRAILAGIGVGLGTTLGVAAITFKACGLNCGGGGWIVAAGIGAGAVTTAALARERWVRMPISWLETR